MKFQCQKYREKQSEWFGKSVHYDFSEPQHGKDVCDRIICPMKLAVRRFFDEGHDIHAVRGMGEALC